MNTYSPVPADLKHEWFLVDATDKVLGRLATEIAHRLRGKHKPGYAPHMDGGDFIVVVNASKIKVTGDKLNKKLYQHHTGYIGNLKEVKYGTLMAEKSDFAMELAIKGMLPDSTLGRKQLTRCRIFKGADHKHEAQKPEAWNK